MAGLVRHKEALGKQVRAAYAMAMPAAFRRPTPLLSLAIVLGLSVAILLAMGRPPICTCGTVALWGREGPTQSQMLADWYSLSHIVHGFLFYAILHLLFRRTAFEHRFLGALIVEASWEVVENTPFIIDRYRTATAALGYSGDSVLNSVSDIVMMGIGFLAARKLPVWASVALLIVLELVPLYVIRDNLTLNVWMLLWPDKAVAAWQSAG
jgi:hypothetical protein